MMQKAKKICAHHVCNTAILQGNRHCPDHKQPVQIHTKSTIYKTARWQKLRALRLRMEPLCRICSSYGITTEATTVDHIVPIQDGGELWDIDNTQSLCNRCHNEKTGKEIRARNKNS